MSSSSTNYRLYYFDMRDLAEMSRMILHYAKVPFEDVRISHEEWRTLKQGIFAGSLLSN